jgi:hypothetical protein
VRSVATAVAALVPAVAAVAVLAAGCSQDTLPPDASLTPPPVLTAEEAGDAFVSAFRQQFPELAQGRADPDLLAAAEVSCAAITSQGAAGTAQLTQTFANGAVSPDPTQAASIALLAATTVCASTTGPPAIPAG